MPFNVTLQDEVTEYLSGTDIVTCKIKAVVSRKAHLQDDFDAASLSGNSIRVGLLSCYY